MTRSGHETNDALTEAVRAALAEFGVRDETVVVAVSGGPDSVALLHILIKLRDALSLRLHVAHLNHMLRGDAGDNDAEFVCALAQGLGIPCTCESRDTRAHQAGRHNSSVEGAARDVRHAFLAEVADAAGATRIALGHTVDDQAETVLLQLVRGTGLSGLRGMLPVRGRLIRPLLGVRRDGILAFLKTKGIEYCIDETNLRVEFARNRMRSVILPILQREFNPRAAENIARTAALVRMAEEWAEAELDRSFDELITSRRENQITLAVPALLELPALLRQLAIRHAIRVFDPETPELSLAHIQSVDGLVTSGLAEGRVFLPGGNQARRSGDELSFGKIVAKNLESAWELPVEVPGVVQIPAADLSFSCEVMPRKPESSQAPATESHEAFMDWGRVKGRLVIRNRRPGDRFHPLGAPGSRKLKDFFIDIKLPQPERDRIPLLVDEDGIICVLGFVIADRVRVQPETETLLHVVLR